MDFHANTDKRQRSSAVERGFHKAEVTGSNPVAGTNAKPDTLYGHLVLSSVAGFERRGGVGRK